MFFRSFSSLVVCAAFVLPFTGLSVFATRRPRAHIARGLSQSISQTFTVIAFSLMPLAGAEKLMAVAPASGIKLKALSQTFTVIAFCLMPLAGPLGVAFLVSGWSALSLCAA